MDSEFLQYASGIIAGYGTGSGLSNIEIDTALSKYAVIYDVKIPHFGMIAKSKKLASALAQFNDEAQANIIHDLCLHPHLQESLDVDELYKTLVQRYGYLLKDDFTQSDLIESTRHWMSEYPTALKLYESGLSKYQREESPRDILDDMRLALELLTKEILGNNKSLENQQGEIGAMLKEVDVSKELRNMVPAIIRYYTDYQNQHVKHDDSVNEHEISYVIEITSVLMKFLIRLARKTGRPILAD